MYTPSNITKKDIACAGIANGHGESAHLLRILLFSKFRESAIVHDLGLT